MSGSEYTFIGGFSSGLETGSTPVLIPQAAMIIQTSESWGIEEFAYRESNCRMLSVVPRPWCGLETQGLAGRSWPQPERWQWTVDSKELVSVLAGVGYQQEKGLRASDDDKQDPSRWSSNPGCY